nr:MAG TPA: Restriction endonuclease [Caudoviricetes sp.]
MKRVFNFYKKHKLAALFTALWFLFMVDITVSGLRNGSTQDPVEVGSGIFAGIIMFIPVALIIAALSAMLSKIFGTLSEIVHINGTDSNELVEPVAPEKTMPTPEISPEPVIKPEPEAPQVPIYDTMEGHDFEYYCAGLLKNNGFYNVSVTQGSGDQGIDVLAEKGGVKYGIQCKCYSKDIGNKAVQEAFAGKTFYHCHVAVVLTNRFFTKSAQELAAVNQVLLWDRNQLEKFVQNSH